MTRGPWQTLAASLARRRGARWGFGLIGGFAALALAADLLASDKPLLLHLRGETYVLANLTRPAPLQPHTVATLWRELGPEDWMVAPLVPWGPNEQDLAGAPLAPPGAAHWLGTDTARRDVLARLIHGTRLSFIVGLASVALALFLGTLLGLVAAYYGGWTDALVSRLIEAMMSVPVFVMVLAVMGVLARAGLASLVLVVGLVSWTRVARLVRAEALRLRQREFIQAAEALGYSAGRIMLRHLLPNSLGPVLVAAAFGVPSAILVEASLSFLGFGAPDSAASWGGLLHGAMGNMGAWWLVLFPGAAIFLAVSAFNLAGEALRDALDPRLRD